MCKYMKKARRSQPCISMNLCTESSSSMWVSLNRKSMGYSTKWYKWFSKQLTIWKNDMFLCFEHSNVFNTLVLKQTFKKLEYRFFVKSTNITDANFRYKLILSEANINTNRMRSTKQIYHKKRTFACDDFGLLNALFFSIRSSCKELIWCIDYSNVHFHTFCKCWSFSWHCFSSLSILERY